jgi:nucleoside-diphosphate-sugar epimerase
VSNILLTGASGFVGEHVLRSLLALKENVITVSRRRPQVTGNYEWIKADLLTETADRILQVENISCIIHAAWCVEHGKFWNDPANDAWRRTTVALARNAAAKGIGRFLSLGTCFEYDWPENADCDESLTPTAHHTLYDRAKDRTRVALEQIASRSEMSLCWARLFFPFGRGETSERLIPSIIQSLARGTPARCSTGAAIRDFIAIEDAAQLLVELSLSDVTGCVNIASGRAVSVAEIATLLGQISGRADLIRLGALPDREAEPPRITAKIGRAGHMPTFSSIPKLEQRLAETYEFWSKQGR